MSKTTEKPGFLSSHDLIMDEDMFRTIIASTLIDAQNQMTGELLTMTDTLNLPDIQSKAVKDIIKKTIRRVLGQVMGDSLENIIKDLKEVGFKIDSQSTITYPNLSDYWAYRIQSTNSNISMEEASYTSTLGK